MKPEWGIKRTCQECDATFYDLKKNPITCPKCFAIYDEKALAEKRAVSLNGNEETETETVRDDELYIEDEFFLDTPTELLESLEEIEDEYEGKQARTN